jgi:hypothetical protein
MNLPPHPFPPRIDPATYLFYLSKDIFSLIGYFILQPAALNDNPRLCVLPTRFSRVFRIPAYSLYAGFQKLDHRVVIFSFSSDNVYKSLFEWDTQIDVIAVNIDWFDRLLVLRENYIEIRNIWGHLLGTLDCDAHPKFISMSMSETYIEYEDRIISSAGRTFKKFDSTMGFGVTIENKLRWSKCDGDATILMGWDFDNMDVVFQCNRPGIHCILHNRISGPHIFHFQDCKTYIDNKLLSHTGAFINLLCFTSDGHLLCV